MYCIYVSSFFSYRLQNRHFSEKLKKKKVKFYFISQVLQKSNVPTKRSLRTGEVSRHPIEKNGGPWVSIRGRSEKLIELQVPQDNVTIPPAPWCRSLCTAVRTVLFACTKKRNFFFTKIDVQKSQTSLCKLHIKSHQNAAEIK